VRFWYDTEFLEDGKTIELISIGIVAEDGREYYAVNKDAPWKRIKKQPWLMENVVPSLPHGHGDRRLHMPKSWLVDFADPLVKPKDHIASAVVSFINPHPLAQIELWADYGAYDHVVLCQLWGTMIDLPEGMPMFTHDIQQEARRLSVTKMLPEQDSGYHNALADARHCRDRWRYLDEVRRNLATA
jgi:hypothetical protein